MEKQAVYTYAQMIKVLETAANGKKFSTSQIKKLMERGKIEKIFPPDIARGVYTVSSVTAYAKELEAFYSTIRMIGE
jgi:hypothetical protein